MVIGPFQPGAAPQPGLHIHQLTNVMQEPAIDLGSLVNILDSHFSLESVADIPDALGIGQGQLGKDLFQPRLLCRAPAVRAIATIWPLPGSIANWMLLPPVSTPISRMIAIAASRMRWYSLSVSVCAGATVIESPV